MLNNRELAGVILYGGLVLFMCVKFRSVWTSFTQLARAFFATRLAVLWLAYAATVGTTAFLESRLNLNYDGYIKDAVVWALLAGLPILFKFDAIAKDPLLLRRALRDAVALTAFVEVFVNLYVFRSGSSFRCRPASPFSC